MLGGYFMVDCTGLNLSDLGTVDGLFTQLETAVASGKPIILYNVEDDGSFYAPLYTVIIPTSTGYTFTIGPALFDITSASVVSDHE